MKIQEEELGSEGSQGRDREMRGRGGDRIVRKVLLHDGRVSEALPVRCCLHHDDDYVEESLVASGLY